MTETTIYYVEEIRRLRRQLARAEGALKNIRDEATPGTTTHSAAVRALDENDREAA